MDSITTTTVTGDTEKGELPEYVTAEMAANLAEHIQTVQDATDNISKRLKKFEKPLKKETKQDKQKPLDRVAGNISEVETFIATDMEKATPKDLVEMFAILTNVVLEMADVINKLPHEVLWTNRLGAMKRRQIMPYQTEREKEEQIAEAKMARWTDKIFKKKVDKPAIAKKALRERDGETDIVHTDDGTSFEVHDEPEDVNMKKLLEVL